MKERDLPQFDSFEERENRAQPLGGGSLSTETIDLASLLTNDMYSSGSFDLSSVGSTSFGRLLDALPMPVILIDQWYTVGFANRACGKISRDYMKLLGVPFLDLVPRPADEARGRALTQKTQSLLERVFSTRKPQVAEAILEIHKKRVWARLHLRTVRIGSDRQMLVVIEDLTLEKRQLELNRRQEIESSRTCEDLEKAFQAAKTELCAATEQLKAEIAAHETTRKKLFAERRKLEMVWDSAPLAAALVAPWGAFEQINRHFTDLFGYRVEDLPNLRDWIVEVWPDGIPGHGTGEEWLKTLTQNDANIEASAMAAVTCKDGATKGVSFLGSKLDDGYYFIVCRIAPEHRDRIE